MPAHATGIRDGMLERYLEIESLARQMLSEARAQDWQGVTRRGLAIRALADQLRADLDRFPLSAEQRRARLVIARRLLGIDADIRRLACPGSRALDALFEPGRHGPDGGSPASSDGH